MNSTLALAAVLSLALAFLALPVLGFLRLATLGFLIAAVVLPFPILLWNSQEQHHTGITYGTPNIATYTLALSALTIGLVRNWKRSGWLLAYGLGIALYLAVGLFTVWTGAEAQWAGAIHWLFALLALVGGYQYGSQMSLDLYRYLIGIALSLFVLNGLLCVAQLAGLPASIFPDQLASNIASGRPIGTFTHPSTLGKFVMIMLIIALPALLSQDSRLRRLAWWCFGIAAPLVALTLARANLAAVIVALILWLLVDRRHWVTNPKRVLYLIGALVLSAPIIAATLERFATDPGGGDRASIYRTGLKQISSDVWGGTGPNYYAEIVGRWDQMTAWGYPLHNSFLYPVAELGLVGGVLFVLPVFVVCAVAIADSLGRNPSPWSTSYLVTFPGLMAIAMTGWGMLSGSTLCLWFFAIGLCAGAIVRKDTHQFLRPDSLKPQNASKGGATVLPLNR